MYIHYRGVVRNLNLRVQHNEREEEEYFLVSLPQNLQIQFENFSKSTGSIEPVEPVLTTPLIII